jgi:hypothetical protein
MFLPSASSQPPRRLPAMLLLLGVGAILFALRIPAQQPHIFARGAVRDMCYVSTSCFSGCTSETRGQFVPVETSIGCSETCCPAQPPLGTCYYSDKCGVGCHPGYVSVASQGLCEDLCCVPGSTSAGGIRAIARDEIQHMPRLEPADACLGRCATASGWTSASRTALPATTLCGSRVVWTSASPTCRPLAPTRPRYSNWNPLSPSPVAVCRASSGPILCPRRLCALTLD